MKLLSTRTLLAATLAVSASAQAGVVTVGSLTRDTAQTTITDTLNNRTWLGWDVTKGLTYAQTLAAIGTGGQFAGYQIARVDDAMLFAKALLGTSACTATATYGVVCGTGVNTQVRAVTGDSFSSPAFSTDYDYAFYLSDNGTGQEVGLLESTTYSTNASQNSFAAYNEWYTIAGTSQYNSAGFQIGWLLYRDGSISNDVPEPGTLALTGLALLAATRLRRKA